MTPLPPGPFDVVIADPPWRFASNSAARPGRNAMRHYDCMAVPEVAALPIADMVPRDALLLLWVTVPFAEKAFDVVRAWGFTYKSQVAWQKSRIGTGYWARNRHELLYICRHGRFPCARPLFPDSVIVAPTREHSRKPSEPHERVEAAYPTARKAELFARETRPGWTAWGNDVGKFGDAP